MFTVVIWTPDHLAAALATYHKAGKGILHFAVAGNGGGAIVSYNGLSGIPCIFIYERYVPAIYKQPGILRAVRAGNGLFTVFKLRYSLAPVPTYLTNVYRIFYHIPYGCRYPGAALAGRDVHIVQLARYFGYAQPFQFAVLIMQPCTYQLNMLRTISASAGFGARVKDLSSFTLS